MVKDRIYENVIRFAKRGAQGDELTWYHLLYGYVKLFSMDSDVLTSLIETEEEERQLREIKVIFDKTGIDRGLAKRALPMLWMSGVTINKEIPDLKAYEEEFEEKMTSAPAEYLLREILSQDLPELELLAGMKEFDYISDYIDQHRPAEGEPQQERPVREGHEEPAGEKAAGEEAAKDAPDAAPEKEPVREAAKEGPEAAAKETAPQKSGQEPADKSERFMQLVRRTREMHLALQERVLGQEDAIHTFVEGYFQAEVFRIRGEEQKSPSGVFLFAGPSGTGKTFLAMEAARALGRPYQKFDMSEYEAPSSTIRFCGVPKNFSDSRPGKVTSFVKEHPAALLIFDEIEKASQEIMHLFLQILDGGTLVDRHTEEAVSFADTLIIFTTNAGKRLYEDRTAGLSSLPRQVVIDAIAEDKSIYGHPLFPAALCSRFASGNVVMFNHLNVSHLIDITDKVFGHCAEETKKQLGYELEFDPKLSTVFLFGLGSHMDARSAHSQSGRMIKSELYEFGRHVPDSQDLSRLEKIRFEVALPEDDETRRLLQAEGRTRVLMIADQGRMSSVPLSRQIEVTYAQAADEAFDLFQNQDFDYVLIDPYFRPRENEHRYLSLDDYRTEGIAFFDMITEKLAEVPVFLLALEPIDIEERQIFLQRGCRGFIEAESDLELADEISRLSSMLYLQTRADDLADRGRVLSYDTAQTISEDGTSATIRFYDFKVHTAVQAGDRKAFLADQDRPKETFDDVIGAENAKSELRFFMEYLENPRRFIATGNPPPKGVLLYGPPGTGKTMLARALAGESNASFFPTAASSFGNKYVGESERGIRELFRAARRYAPSIIFIDEIDAIGKTRTGSETTHHTESMLNALLTEMDGFQADASKPVFVLAATNFDLDGLMSGKDTHLDEALIRRFSNRIYVDLPNREERLRYIRIMMKSRENEVGEATMDNIAGRTTGESLATIKNVIDLAGRNALKNKAVLDDECLLHALEEYMYGEKKEWDEAYYRSVAVHESGHAYISWLSGVKPGYVTIVSRGKFGGYMQEDSREKEPSRSREQLLWEIRTCLAGRAAEVCYFGEGKGVNTGIASDLQDATSCAINMICRYGMVDGSLLSIDPKLMLNSPMGADLLRQVDRILSEEMETTKKLIEEGRPKIDRLVDRLISDNQVIGDTILSIFEDGDRK